MVDAEQRPESAEPTPLKRAEIIALAGTGLVFIGTMLPALDPGSGEAQSLSDFASAATVIFWGFAGSVIWSVTRRRAYEATVPGVLILLSLLVFGIFVWLENVSEPVRTFFGLVKAEFRPIAWTAIAIGSALIQIAGIRSGTNRICKRSSSQLTDRIKVVGVTLAVLGCLMGISLVNPFRDGAPADIRRLSHAYADELKLLRWLWMGSAAFCIVACSQSPERALHIVQKMVRLAGLIIGAGIFVLLTVAVPQTRLLAMLIGAAWTVFGITVWMTEDPSQTLARWKKLIIASPFGAVFGLLLMSGEFGDLLVFLYPVFALAAGYVIGRNTEYVDTTIFVSALAVGLPTGLMAIRGVAKEISDLLGLSAAEARLAATGICCLLGWAVVLSIQNVPAVSSDLVDMNPESDVNEPNRERKK